MSLKSWEKRGKRGLTRALGRAFRARGEAGTLPDLADLESILLIRQQNQLGDMLLCTPAVRAVRARAPAARIDFVSGPPNHEAIRGNRHLDEVLLYDKTAYLRRPGDGRRFAERLRTARYDLALVLNSVAFSCTSAWLAVLSGAQRRAGRPGEGGQGSEIAADVFHWSLPPPTPGRHQTAVNLDLVTPFGAPAVDARPELCLDPEESAAGARVLDDVLGGTGETGGLRVVIHPGAGKRPNRWSAEGFGRVAAALVARGHAVALAAGPAETVLLDALERGAGTALPRLPSLAVRAFAGALAGADLVLANDTGVLHVAAAMGVPVLALFGPTDPAEWCPAVPWVRTLRAPQGDLARLEAEIVIDAATGLAASLAGAGEVPSVLMAAPEVKG